MNIGVLTVSLGCDTIGLNKATKSMNIMAQRFRTFGYLASMAITAPIVMAGKAVFKMAKDYEYSMQKIVGLTGVAQSAVNDWSAEILKLGPQLGKTPQELADALYYISSSGIRGAEAMDVLKLSAKAAAAGLGETQTVANYLTSVLMAYQGTGITAAYATDVLVAAVRVGKAEATGFASAMGGVIPIAAQLGVSIDQVAGGLAAITLSGASAANAATYLRGVFNALLKGGELGKGAAALTTMKTSYQELRDVLRTQGLIPLMQKLNDMSAQYGETLYSKVFPNIRAMLGVLSIAGKNFKYNTQIMNEVTNSTGSLGAAWKAVADTIKIKYDRAISAANVSMITLGKSVAEAALPMLEKLIQQLNKLTIWFDSLTEAQKRHKLSWLAFIAILGPASLLISLIGYALSGLVTIVRGAIFAFNVLKTVMIANPYLAVIGFVATLAGGYLLLKNRTKDVADEQSRLNKLMDEADRANEDKKSIGERIDVLFALNPRQLEELKNDIGTQKILQENQITNLEAYRKTWLENDTGWIAMRKKQDFNEYNLRGWENKVISEQDQVQEFRWRESVNTQQKYMQEYIKNRESFIATQLKTADEQKGVLDKWAKQVEEQFKKVMTPIKQAEAALKQYLEEQQEVMDSFDDLAEGELHINRMTKLLGDGFDTASAKTELYNKILETLADTTIPLTDERMLELVKAVKLINETITPILKEDWKKTLGIGTGGKLAVSHIPTIDFDIESMNTLQEELAQIALKETWMGDTFDNVAAQTNVLENAIDALYRKYPEGNALIYDLISQYDALIVKQNEIGFSAKRMGNTLANVFTDMATQMGAVIVGQENAWMAMVDTMLQGIQQVISLLLAEAIAAMIAKESYKGLVGLITMAVGLGGIMALWGKYKSKVAGEAKMAGGGVIPDGYPNDSYPARLTSKETILPPKALSSIMNQSDYNERLVAEVTGEQLNFILIRTNRKKNSYR